MSDFMDHLEKCHEQTKDWPEWKKNCIKCQVLSDETPIQDESPEGQDQV